MNRAAPLRVLIVEHDEADAELVLLELRRAGFVVDGTIVGTPEQFAAMLHDRPFDIVLSDYRLPSWTGMDALVQLRALGLDTPLILVTGTLGDERAVECVKRGAADYIIKDNLARLPLAVTRALDERLAITDRLTAQRALMESEARYRTLTEASFDAIAISQNGIILEVNGGFATIFGYSPGEIIGRPILDCCAPESVDEVRARVLAGAEGTYEMVGQRKDGQRLLLESTAKVTAINGQPARITALRDLTGRRQLEEQFRQAQKMEAVGRLAGGVAHDFNNLLTIITGYATLVCDDLDRDHPGRQGVEQIQKAANDAAALTRQLLLFSRQQVIVPRITALDTVVQQSKKMLQRLIGEDITLVTSHGVIRPTTMIDPGEVEQVIMNLVVNSRDAMPTGGRVTIRTGVVDLAEADVRDILLGTPGRFVVLAVGDTGTGMDVDTRARIFEPFFTTKPEGTGTGLGLATVYGVVKARGGSIHVDSEVGRGTTFTIYLPYGTDELEGDDPAGRVTGRGDRQRDDLVGGGCRSGSGTDPPGP